MGIRDDLAAQAAEFVGLRELLEQLAAHEGVTLQEAATWLSGKLQRADRVSTPKWVRFDPAIGVRDPIASDWAVTQGDALEYVSKYGAFATQQELDEYAIHIPF